VYQGQKVHLFSPSLTFQPEAQQGLKNRREQKALFGRGAHFIFLPAAPTTNQKTSLEKSQIYFESTFFK
jgi:hypothetical protein